MVKALLLSRGIPVREQAGSIGRISGMTSGPLSEVRLLVPADRAAEARELIERTPERPPVNRERLPATTRLMVGTLLVILAALVVLSVVMLATRFA